MTEGECPRCGSGGYDCYECTPITYTQADLEAAVNEALERAAEIAARKIFAGGEDRSETASSVYRAIRAIKKGEQK